MNPRPNNTIIVSLASKISLAMILLFIVVSLLAYFGLLAADFELVNHDNPYAPPSWDYWFGTDLFGRSVLSRAIHGCVTALIVGFFSSLISLSIGVFLGLISGYFGKAVDSFVIWLYTTIDSVPYILIVTGLAYSLGPGVNNLLIALGLTLWTKTCRIIRSETLSQKNEPYVLAADAIGAGHIRRLGKHIFPNISHIASIQFGLCFVTAIKMEVLLSYIGLGVEPGAPSWGMMINDAKLELGRGVWWNLAAATLLLTLLTLAVNTLLDGLRTSFNPKKRNL